MYYLTILKRCCIAASLFSIPCVVAGQVDSDADVSAPKTTDQEIARHVEHELRLDRAVGTEDIEVESDAGIVRLSGNVDNLISKSRAARIASAIKGVRSVVNEIAVVPPRAYSDNEVRQNIRDALLTNAATDAYEITVDVTDGAATLNGRVDSWQEKELATSVSKRVAGVREVFSNIEVNVPQDRPDAEIARDVREALRWDVYIPSARLIEVECEDGKVTLTGTVGSASERYRAYTNAWVSGVEEVNHDQLKVNSVNRDTAFRDESIPELTDQSIQQAVNDAMLFDPRVVSFNVDAEVDYGVVTLTGTVTNLSARKAAEGNARNTVGVKNVVNQLVVKSDESTDDEIESQVRSALRRHPYLEAEQILVRAEGGLVMLSGSVDTFFEKQEAEDVASRVDGALLVDNGLLVVNDESAYFYDPYVDESIFDDYVFYNDLSTVTRKPDRDILTSIKSELFWSPFVDENEVTVTVNDGTATLTGTVDSWSEKRAARENALEGGAIKVVNQLTIE